MVKLLRPALAGLIALLAVACGGRTASAPQAAPPAAAVPAATAPAPVTDTAAATLFAGATAAGGGNAAAYDSASRRAFVVNGADARVDIYDMANPSAPLPVGSIDVTPFGQEPTSVAVSNGLVAIGVEADKKPNDGTVVLADVNGTILNDLRVGPLPAALAFTPDGARLVVANKGEANKEQTKNPEGSISIIDLRGDPAALGKRAVRTADFAQFNAGAVAAALDPQIRVAAPNATVAQELEPDGITIAPDGRSARVTLHKNRAVADVDLETATVTALLPLDDGGARVQTLRDLPIADLPSVGTTEAGQTITLGGFSALAYTGTDADSGLLNFLTLTDRGPNASPADVLDDGVDARPFPLPGFTPRIVRLAVDPATGAVRYMSEMLLTNPDGAPLTGLPNLAGPPGRAGGDEAAMDLRGNPLPYDTMGIDPEGMAVAADGSFWIVEEYRPSLLHFDADGRLLRRFVPEGANANTGGAELGVEALPAVLMQRTANHGFEAAAFEGSILYAFMQSPIDNPDRPDDSNAKAATAVRIVAFDTATEQTVGQYLYIVDGGNVDKLGDAVALGNGEFLVIERDDLAGPAAQKYIYKISLAGATNLEEFKETAPVGYNQGLETQPLPLLQLAGIQPVQKQLYVDLTAAGYTQADKLEGLALIDGSHLALVNDDDFGMSGAFDPATGTFTLSPARVPSLLTLVEIEN